MVIASSYSSNCCLTCAAVKQNICCCLICAYGKGVLVSNGCQNDSRCFCLPVVHKTGAGHAVSLVKQMNSYDGFTVFPKR